MCADNILSRGNAVLIACSQCAGLKYRPSSIWPRVIPRTHPGLKITWRKGIQGIVCGHHFLKLTITPSQLFVGWDILFHCRNDKAAFVISFILHCRKGWSARARRKCWSFVSGCASWCALRHVSLFEDFQWTAIRNWINALRKSPKSHCGADVIVVRLWEIRKLVGRVAKMARPYPDTFEQDSLMYAHLLSAMTKTDMSQKSYVGRLSRTHILFEEC